MRFRSVIGWVLKSKRANHMVRRGIYQEEGDALDDFNTIPIFNNDGCGKRSDYEIIKVEIKEAKG